MRSSIPLRISPFFWITAAIIGWLNSYSLIGTAIWIVIIFVSILVHEYGHALTAKLFGQDPRIELMAFGGVTYPEGPRISLWKEFIVVLNGPLFGFMLYLFGSMLLSFPAIAASKMAPAIQMFRLVNLFWTIVNLFPVLPLDGGQLLRIILEMFMGAKGFKLTVVVSMVLAFCFAIASMVIGWFLIGAIFFLFAFQNIQTWRFAKAFTLNDQNQDLQKELFKAEEEMLQGREDNAETILHTLRESSKTGLLYTTATQHLIRIKFKKGQIKETHDLLLAIEENLTPEFLELLHFTSFELKDYQKVKDLSAVCFQNDPCLEIALRNAIALSFLKEVKPTIGWIEAAMRAGLENPIQILQEKAFDPIRQEPDFLFFVDKLSEKA